MKTGSKQDRLNIWIIILLFIVAAGFLGLSAASIYRNSHNHINESIIKSKTQAQLLGENTSSMIYTVDFALLSFCSMIKNEPDSTGITPSLLAFIKAETTYLPQIQNIVFLNANGEIELSIQEPGEFTLSSFDEHQSAWLEFSIETVFFDENKAMIILSRRIENQSGEFLGVLAAVIDSDFFYGRYDDYLVLDASAVAFFDNQGKTLASWYNHPDFKKHVLAPNNQFVDAFSSMTANGKVPGGSRTYEDKTVVISTYQIRGFPYHVAVMHAKKHALQKWRQETKRDIFIIAATFLTALFTIALAFRQRGKRKKAEFRLMEHQLNLEKTIRKRTEQLHLTNMTLLEKNKALEKALGEIKTLSGLLPICMHCKKIRDDQGYWNQMEAYIQKHSNAKLSHGICRECAEKLYPDMNLYDDN
jgi:hypothetical protein